ncbi:capsule biosynthesis GfcC family protein [Vibrio alginolyticus]|nr:capsule biosynthesis GfcC family protein [Vibrio alginolyticus]
MSKRPLSLLNIALTSLILLANTSTAYAQSTTEQAPSLNVELTAVGKELQFSQAARLSDVLKQAQQQDLILQYPLATTLFNGSEEALRESASLKNSVLNQMVRYNLNTHPMYQFIQQHQFAPRLLSAIDLDDVRLDKFNNPLLIGELALISQPREGKITYLGNVNKVYSVTDQSGIPLQDQIKSLEGDIGKLTNPPVIVYPDGKVIQPHHGSWLTTQYYLPPLTMVYIPFDEYETSKMDQDIVQLLTQLKPTVMKKPQ